MSMFTIETGIGKNMDLIPDKELVWVNLNIKDKKTSKETGGEYFELEMIVLEGQYAKRHLWDKIMNPLDPKNSEKSHEFSKMALCRIFEMIGIFDFNKPDTYLQFEGLTFDDIGTQIQDHARKIGIRVGFEDAKGGYKAKNTVKEWLSPYPKSGGYKGWAELNGITPVSSPSIAGRAASLFSSPTVQAQPSFSAPAGAAPSWITP